MESERQKLVEIHGHKKFVSFKVCSECGSRMLVNREQVTVFHPAINTVVQKISEVVTRFPDTTHIKRKFPSMDCRHLCAAKVLANSVIKNVMRNEPKSLVHIQELSEKITRAPDVNQTTRDQKYCNLCSLRFTATCHTVNHLMLRHPECLALVQFLQSRPLSELNIPKDFGVLHQSYVKVEKKSSHIYNECITKGYISLKQNTGTPSLFDAQPNSRLKAINEKIVQNNEEMKTTLLKTSQNLNTKDKLKQNTGASPFFDAEPNSCLNVISEEIVQNNEEMKKEIFKTSQNLNTKDNLKQKNGARSLFDAQPNSNLNTISEEIVQNSEEISAEMKKNIFKTSQNLNTKDTTAILFPKIIFKTRRDTCNLEKPNSSHCKNAVVLATSKIIRYGVEDLKRDRLREQQKKEKMEEKEKILKKMLAKYHEKETKKEVLYWQKKLTRYVTQHQNLLFKLEPDLINARQSGMHSIDKLLEKVGYYVKNYKVKKTVIYLLKELFEAMKKVPGIKEIEKEQFEMDWSSTENSFEEVDQPQTLKCSAKNRKTETCRTSSFPVEDNSADFSSASNYELNLDPEDPFILPTFASDDKQLFLCFCEKLDCVGLHPESFY